jgi:hypothetical protein
MTYTFGYILHRSCWPSFVRMCCVIKSMATWLSPPRGMITSAYFFDGRTKSSKAGLTNFAYYKSQHYRQLGITMQCDSSHLIRCIKLFLHFLHIKIAQKYKFCMKELFINISLTVIKPWFLIKLQELPFREQSLCLCLFPLCHV